jgi:hypothetical protein
MPIGALFLNLFSGIGGYLEAKIGARMYNIFLNKTK